MRISVYLPTKNRQPQLQCAVQSVLNQTLQDFELIVVNDGSTDATRGYLDALQAADSRVRVIHHEHSRGAPAARNAAIAIAHADWITGLDDDDEFSPRRLELLLQYAEFLCQAGAPFSGVFSQEFIKSDGGVCQRSEKRGPVHFADLLESNRIGNQLFARKSVYVDSGCFDTTLPAWQDLDLFLRIAKMFGPAQLLDVPLYMFNDAADPDRISSQKKQRIIDSYRIVSAKHTTISRRQRQSLYMQIFSDFYGFSMSTGDLLRYLRIDAGLSSVAGLARLLRRT